MPPETANKVGSFGRNTAEFLIIFYFFKILKRDVFFAIYRIVAAKLCFFWKNDCKNYKNRI